MFKVQACLLGGIAALLLVGELAGARARRDDPREIFDAALKKGQHLQNQFEYRKALAEYQKAEHAATRIGPGSDEMGRVCDRLGHLHRILGNYSSAEKYYTRCLQIFKNKDNASEDVANANNNLGLVDWMQGNYVRGEQRYKEAIRIMTVVNPKALVLAYYRQNLAVLYMDWDKLDSVGSLFQDSLAVLEKHKDTSWARGMVYNNLGRYHQARHQFDRGRHFFNRAVEMLDHKANSDHDPFLARAVTNLGVLNHAEGHLAEAEADYKRGLGIRRAAFSAEHPDLALSLDSLAGVNARQGQWKEATRQADEARRILARHVSQVLVALSDFEKLDFLKTRYLPEWHGALSLGLARPHDPSIVEHTAEWVLNGKAMAVEVFAATLLKARDEKNADLKDLIKQLREVQEELAALRLGGVPKKEPEAFRKKLAALSDKEQRLTQEVARAGGHRLPGKEWVTLHGVREALPAAAVLVEIVRLKVWDFQFKGTERSWKGEHYVAWVIPAAGKGTVKIVDLGPAEKIDAAVKALQKLLDEAGKLKPEKREENFKKVEQGLTGLARQILWPVLKEAGTARRLILSPDHLLWVVPWAALPLENKKFVLQEYPISFMVTGRDLLPRAVPRQGRAPAQPAALVMSNPDFDASSDDIEAAPRRHVWLRNLQDPPKLSGSKRDLLEQLGPALPLPFAEKEGDRGRGSDPQAADGLPQRAQAGGGEGPGRDGRHPPPCPPSRGAGPGDARVLLPPQGRPAQP
jgi:tetratricopeptide (TPR) repeat protein